MSSVHPSHFTLPLLPGGWARLLNHLADPPRDPAPAPTFLHLLFQPFWLLLQNKLRAAGLGSSAWTSREEEEEEEKGEWRKSRAASPFQLKQLFIHSAN